MIYFTPSRPTVVQPQLYDRIAVTIYLQKDDIDTAEELAHIFAGQTYRVEKVAEKKTLSQVGYAWLLISRIAEKTKLNKNDVYREYVRRSHKYEINRFPTDIAKKYIKIWEQLGTGFQGEILTDLGNELEIICYIGISKWNRKELSGLIDQIKQDCYELKIPTER